MSSTRTITLNEFGLARRERTSNAGTTSIKYTVSIDAAPMVHTFDSKSLGRGPADAIADHLRGRVAGIGERAAPATIRRRELAAKAFASGDLATMKRYGGGRIGAMPPNQSDRMFNDSGRMARGIAAGPTKDNQWVVNFPANRFDPSTLKGGEAGVIKMFERLRQLIPEFGDVSILADVAAVRQAIDESTELIISRNTFSVGGSLVSLGSARAARLDALRAGLELFQQIAA